MASYNAAFQQTSMRPIVFTTGYNDLLKLSAVLYFYRYSIIQLSPHIAVLFLAPQQPTSEGVYHALSSHLPGFMIPIFPTCTGHNSIASVAPFPSHPISIAKSIKQNESKKTLQFSALFVARTNTIKCIRLRQTRMR